MANTVGFVTLPNFAANSAKFIQVPCKQTWGQVLVVCNIQIFHITIWEPFLSQYDIRIS